MSDSSSETLPSYIRTTWISKINYWSATIQSFIASSRYFSIMIIFSFNTNKEFTLSFIWLSKDLILRSLISLSKCSTPTSSASKALTWQGILTKICSTNCFWLTIYFDTKAFIGKSVIFLSLTFASIKTGFLRYC